MHSNHANKCQCIAVVTLQCRGYVGGYTGSSSATSHGHVKRPQTAVVTSPDQVPTKESLLTRPKTPAGGSTTNGTDIVPPDSPKVRNGRVLLKVGKLATSTKCSNA